MRTIQELSAVDELKNGDLFVIWQTENGDTRKISANNLLKYIEENLRDSKELLKQYSAPVIDDFVVTINQGNTWLVLMPADDFLLGTLKLPTGVDNEIINVNCTKSITEIFYDGGGSSVIGAPATLAQDSFFTLKYDVTSDAWFRVS